MKKLLYAGGELVSTDALVDAVVDYATRLGQRGATDSLRVPSISPSGTIGESTILIGPASEIMAEPAEREEVDLDDGPTIEDLRARTAVLGDVKAATSSGIGPAQVEGDFIPFEEYDA
jgi:hypothetical protein